MTSITGIAITFSAWYLELNLEVDAAQSLHPRG